MVKIVDDSKRVLDLHDRTNRPGGESDDPNWVEDGKKVTDFIKR